MKWALNLYLILIFMIFGGMNCSKAQEKSNGKEHKTEGQTMFTLESDAFRTGENIPVKYTCDGADVSPALSWQGAPQGTKSLALICDDPDAPMGTWVHWIIYNIPATLPGLPENVAKDQAELSGNLQSILQGINSWGKIGYGGPCPPPGPAHRYFFKLYALDTVLAQSSMKKAQLLQAMEGHVLGETQLMGTYQRR